MECYALCIMTTGILQNFDSVNFKFLTIGRSRSRSRPILRSTSKNEMQRGQESRLDLGLTN